jgi:hypothetical protein
MTCRQMAEIRGPVIAGVIIWAVCTASEQAWADAGEDSTAVDSISSVSTGGVSTVRAPSPPAPTRADTLAFRSVTSRVKPDEFARVFSRRGNVDVQGRGIILQGVRRFGNPDSTVPWSDVTKVQARGSAASRGALVGGLLFGAAGLMAMASYTDPCDEFIEITCGANTGDVIVGTLAAAGAGALAGMVLASPFRQWKDVDLRSPKVNTFGDSTFDDSRRGFTLELGAGTGWATADNAIHPDSKHTDLAGFTRVRLGHGLSERWTVACVNDLTWIHGLTGITGLGVSRFSSRKAPSWTLELAGGGAMRKNEHQTTWGGGIQAGLGFEFVPHWLMRATVLHASFDDADWTVVGTSVGKLWY